MSEITCFVFSENDTTIVQNQLAASLHVTVLRVDSLDEALVNRFLTARNGCVVVLGDVCELASMFTNFLVRNHVWIPIVGFVRSPVRMSSYAGIFGTAHNLDELLREIHSAIQFDLSGTHPPAELRRRMCLLTPREREAIDLFLLGENTKTVAKALGITYQTVDKHRGRALRKLGVGSVVDLHVSLQRCMLTSMGIKLDPPAKSGTRTVVPTPHFPTSNSLRLGNTTG